jgi:hypothetical protein
MDCRIELGNLVHNLGNLSNLVRRLDAVRHAFEQLAEEEVDQQVG